MDHVRDGAAAVLTTVFANMGTTGEISRFFKIAGLPWERGNYQRAKLERSTGVVAQWLGWGLPQNMHLKTSLVRGMKPSESWYIDPEILDQAAVALTRYESGRLGYIEYADDSEGAIVAQALFGLLPLD
ncbi:hypothetical protein SNK03_009143 [Fusarium graminearum]|nr:unnamed protein product [Fusarium graminearum]CAG1991948.1 unnamed protein product [Fusarium graminearum]